MHKLLTSLTLREMLFEQLPAFAISFILAELFYKFHSFTLECLAFLGTWYVVDLVITSVAKRFARNRVPVE